jgi:hypothetical protein
MYSPDTVVPNYVIGEIFKCNITITFIRGTTTPILNISGPAFAIQILSIQNTFIGTTLTNINININLTSSNTALINFGTIINTPSNISSDKQCTFELTGRIKDNSTIFSGSTFNLRSDLQFEGKVLTSQLSYTIREPSISLV